MRFIQHTLAAGAALLAALAGMLMFGAGFNAAGAAGTPAALHADHVGATNPGFQSGECPSSADGTWGWHFVLPGSDTDFVSISATFLHEGTVTSFISQPTAKHAYVFTHQADTLLGATAMVEGPQTWFNLSHVCTGTHEEVDPPTTTIPPTTTAPTTTVKAPTTTMAPTTTAPTTTEAPTTTASAPTTVAEQAAPVAVLGSVEVAPVAKLAFTGSHTVPMLILGAGLLGAGAAMTAASRRRLLQS
jgi:hypothetical protein